MNQPPPTVAALITRGVAPARCVLDSARRSWDAGFYFRLIDGHVAVEAKNMAVEIADAEGGNLLLLEDDIIAPADAWMRIRHFTDHPATYRNTIAFCSATDRSGKTNTHYDSTGEVFWSGTVFLWISRTTLDRLPRPLFLAMDYTPTGDTLHAIGPNHAGHHSDVHAWHEIRNLFPRPSIQHLGPARHHFHRLNEQHNLANPVRLDVR